MIRQGEVYWVDMPEPTGSAPGFRRPCVVIQNDIFNRSPIQTVIVVPLTTQLRRAGDPANVMLARGEGGVPHASVALAVQVMTVDKGLLLQRLGVLSHQRLREILDGVQLVTEPRDIE